MPSFNYAHFLPRAVHGVLSQTFSDLELIITDDCSTDESREVAESYKRLDARVVTLFHDKNRGLAGARNSALAGSSGKFIALCDADDIWQPDKLKVQLECFHNRADVGFVHSDAWIIDGAGDRSGGRFSELFHRKGQPTSGDLFNELCRRNFICVPTVILRREAILGVGGFEAGLRSLEDWVCRTKMASTYHFEYVNEPLVEYRVHGASLSHKTQNMANSRVMALRIMLESLSDIPPHSLAAMFYSLGMSHLQLNDSAEALAAFANSIKASPIQLRSWIRLCQCLPTRALARWCGPLSS